MNEDLRQLRAKIDGDEGFMGGHQILKVRKRTKTIPDWALNNAETKKFLQRVFPNWKNSTTQRLSAARWARVIYLYYREGLSHRQVAEEMKIGYNTLRSLLRNIRRSSKKDRSRGRPKK